MNDQPDNADAASLETQAHTGPIDFDALNTGRDQTREFPLPTEIEGYRILGILGRGGMGVVYRAEQANPKREVALKVIGASFVSDQLLRRFELEAQTLGRLKHVGIAQIYEAGTANTGHGPQPFIAMELVEGEPLDDFAAKRSLDLRTKLELLMKLCDAVQYAHQQGVIHRDLKPGNILITSDGQPKILDFGIARATDADVKTTTLQTSVGQLVGTLPYMSPEQASGNPDEIDTRSDVYALGVISYQFLSGKLPIDMQGVTTFEAARRIREREPTRLSTLNRALRGEVETIVQKAMEKDKTRRYETANALGADVKRFLNYEPISARPPSAWYQLRKFARRNKTLVAGVAMTFVALVAGTIVSTKMYLRAEQQNAVANATADFLMNRVLAGATPQHIPDSKIRDEIVRAMLDPAAANVEEDFKNKPLVEAAVRNSLALSYLHLGRDALALPHAERAVEIYREAQGHDDPTTLQMSNNLAQILSHLGRADEAERLSRDTLARQRRVIGDDHRSTITTLSNLGIIVENSGELIEAEALARESVARHRRVYGNDSTDTLMAMNNLGTVLAGLNRLDEAEQLKREVLERTRRVLGDDHPFTQITVNNMASLLDARGKYAESEPLFRELLERRRRVLGDDHFETLGAMNNLGSTLQDLGRFEEAERLYREAMDRGRRTLGDDHPHTLTFINSLASVLQAQGRFSECEPFRREALERIRRVLGEDHPDTLRVKNNMGGLLQKMGKPELAEPLHREALMKTNANPNLGPKNALTIACARNYARCLETLGRTDEAAAVRREFDVPAPTSGQTTRPATNPAR